MKDKNTVLATEQFTLGDAGKTIQIETKRSKSIVYLTLLPYCLNVQYTAYVETLYHRVLHFQVFSHMSCIY